MKTIYVTEKQWREHTLSGELERAVGDTGRIAGPCPRGLGLLAGEGKVIDLSAWKAENLVELDEPECGEPESGLTQYEGRVLVRRPRRKHEAARNMAELASTLSVAAAVAALVIRVLLF